MNIKDILRYDPETGDFFWIKSGKGMTAGMKAGCIYQSGYIFITIKGKPYRAHRLAWLYMTGVWPSNHIDHKNTIRSDNRWCNLREATNQQNGFNSRKIKKGSSIFKGVSRHKKSGKWEVRVSGNYLGLFDTEIMAAAVYNSAAKKMFGEFARLNVMG